MRLGLGVRRQRCCEVGYEETAATGASQGGRIPGSPALGVHRRVSITRKKKVIISKMKLLLWGEKKSRAKSPR